MQVLNQHQKILHPKDISLPSSSSTVTTETNPGFKSRLSSVVRSDSPAGSSHRPDSPASSFNRSQGGSSSSVMSRVNSLSSSSGPGALQLPSADANLNRFTELGGEDYSDLFGKSLPPNTDGRDVPSSETLKLHTRLSNMSSKSWVHFFPLFLHPFLFFRN